MCQGFPIVQPTLPGDMCILRRGELQLDANGQLFQDNVISASTVYLCHDLLTAHFFWAATLEGVNEMHCLYVRVCIQMYIPY